MDFCAPETAEGVQRWCGEPEQIRFMTALKTSEVQRGVGLEVSGR